MLFSDYTEENDLITDRQLHVLSSDSGVRTDTATNIQQHNNFSEDEASSGTIPLNSNNTAGAPMSKSIPTIVIEDPDKKCTDASDSEALTSESRVNPSHASVEQYLFGSEHFSDVERTPSFSKSSNDSANELHLNTIPSTSSLTHSTDLGDITTCRSKRRLKYANHSEPETKPISSDSGNNDEPDVSTHRSPEKPKFNTVLPTAVEESEESLPGTPKAPSSQDNDNSPPQSPPMTSGNKRMTSFLRSLSPVRLMSLRPKKRVTFTTT